MMGYFRCWSARNLLDLYLDGRLSPAQAGRVKTHLAACEACAAEAAPLNEVRSALADAPNPPMPLGLTDAILKELRQPETPAARPAAPAWRLSPAQAAALVYFAALALGQALPGLPSQAYAEPPAREQAR